MTAARRSGPPWQFWVGLTLVAFSLNWVWEMLRMPAYRETAGRPWAETLGTRTTAALGDVVLIFAIFGLGGLAAGRLRWTRAGVERPPGCRLRHSVCLRRMEGVLGRRGNPVREGRT